MTEDTTAQPAVPLDFLNYTGNKTHLMGRVLGPNRMGEWWQVVTCDYNPDTDRTRVGLVIYRGQ